MAGGGSVVSFLVHLPWNCRISLPGSAMMVPPSTELPRNCGRWDVWGVFSCPLSMELRWKCGRWVFRRSWKACLVGDLWYYSCPVYHHVESWNYSMRVIYSCPVYHHVESRSYSRRVIFTVMSRGVNKQKKQVPGFRNLLSLFYVIFRMSSSGTSKVPSEHPKHRTKSRVSGLLPRGTCRGRCL